MWNWWAHSRGSGQQIDKVLEDLKIPPSRIDEIKKHLYEYRALDLSWALAQKIEPYFKAKRDSLQRELESVSKEYRAAEVSNEVMSAAHEKMSAFRRVMDEATGKAQPCGSSKVVALIESPNAQFSESEQARIMDECHEEFEDLKEYENNKKLRRRGKWIAGRS